MKAFYNILVNTLIVNIANGYVWFALVFWSIKNTETVIAPSMMGGIYLVFTVISSIWFGSLVDHHKKKTAMQLSTIATLILFVLALLFYISVPEKAFANVYSWELWVLTVLILGGAILGNIRYITVPTVTTLLVEADKRDRANGLSGTVFGLSFAICSVISGLLLGFAGMYWFLLSSVIFLTLAIIHLHFIKVPEKTILHTEDTPKKIDIRGTVKVIKSVPGLFALIFFACFNNFLGGVFLALMDAYGLSLVSYEIWGLLWGFLSFGFIFGGILIAKRGLGKNPIKTLFQINIILWTVCIFFTVQPSIWLLAVGMLIYMSLVPFVEATEQTVIQKVIPYERQGRVFGFAQSVEQAASPLTAFFIGPIAQFIFIPYMTTGAGVDLIGGWFGTGMGRGIALVFIVTGIIGLFVTLLCMRLPAYKLLGQKYLSESKKEK